MFECPWPLVSRRLWRDLWHRWFRSWWRFRTCHWFLLLMVEGGKDCCNTGIAGAENITNCSITQSRSWEKCNSYQLMAKHWNTIEMKPTKSVWTDRNMCNICTWCLSKSRIASVGRAFCHRRLLFWCTESLLERLHLGCGSGGALLQRHLLKLLHPGAGKLTSWILLNILWKSPIWSHRNSYTNTAHTSEPISIVSIIYDGSLSSSRRTKMRRLLQRLFQSVSEVCFAKVERPGLTYFKLAMPNTNPYLQFTHKCPLMWSGPVERFKRLQKSATNSIFHFTGTSTGTPIIMAIKQGIVIYNIID